MIIFTVFTVKNRHKEVKKPAQDQPGAVEAVALLEPEFLTLPSASSKQPRAGRSGEDGKHQELMRTRGQVLSHRRRPPEECKEQADTV